ncbi:MAG TPA: hypothetical protein VK886_08155 [Vicinamibacterales bacterium]|nr:hypothetical protein [Vicinamibacterales bacterium]
MARSLIVAGVLANVAVTAIAERGVPPFIPGTSFRFSLNTDPRTDEDRSFVATMTGELPVQSLAFKCLSDGLNVLYSFDKYFAGTDGAVRIRLRFPGQPATPWEDWGLMAGGRQSIAYMPEESVMAFIEEASSHSSITMQAMDPRDGETVTAEFSIVGVRKAVQRLACYQNMPVSERGQ